MLDYFIRKTDLAWFNAPARPAPPLYTRPSHAWQERPTAETPIGQIAPDCKLVKLTDEQLAIWRNT